MNSSLTWNAQKKKAPAATKIDRANAVGSDVAGGEGIIAAFDDEITRLRAGLRTWPPASDQVQTAERLVLLMRMRAKLLQSSFGQSTASEAVTMSPASASAMGISTAVQLSAVTGLDDSRVRQLVVSASELKALEAQVGEETDQRIHELKTKQREILSGISPAIARAKRWDMARRAKL